MPHLLNFSKFSAVAEMGHLCQQQSSIVSQQQCLSFSPVAFDPAGHPSDGLVGMLSSLPRNKGYTYYTNLLKV